MDTQESMHIADGLLSSEVCLATGVLSIGAVGYGIRHLNQSITTKTVPLTGMVAAIIFASQMVNFPLIGAPVSGHLLGGVLAAVILGPWAGCLAITAVLLVQCFLFSDGGFLSLGANILHMGVIGSMGGYAIYATVRNYFGNTNRGIVIGAIVASWLTVMASAALFCLEFAISYRNAGYDLSKLFTLMITWHSLIGIGEAIITGLAVSYILKHKPELIKAESESIPRYRAFGRVSFAGIVLALGIAAFMAPLASGHPDGLEASAEATGIQHLEKEAKSLGFSDYSVPLPKLFSENLEKWEWVSVSLAGILGTVCVFFVSVILGAMTVSGTEKIGDGV